MMLFKKREKRNLKTLNRTHREFCISSHIYSTGKQNNRKDNITKDEMKEGYKYITTLSKKIKT